MSGRVVAAGCLTLMVVAGLALTWGSARVDAGGSAAPRPAPKPGEPRRPRAGDGGPVVRPAAAANDLPDAMPPERGPLAGSEAPLPAQASELPPDAPAASPTTPISPPAKPLPVVPGAAPTAGASTGTGSGTAPPTTASPAAAAVELPPEPVTPVPVASTPMQAAPAHVLPPDPSEVAAHGGGSVGAFSLGSLVLLVLLTGCGAGVIWLRARVGELDDRYSRLKEMLARLDDGHEALQKRLPAGGAVASAAPVARAAPSAGGDAVAPDVSSAVERAVGAALAEQRARLEQVDRRAERLARDLSDALAPSLDEVKRKLDALERRVADGARNPFSAGGRSTPEPTTSVADPTSALAAGLARAATRLGPKVSGGGGADPVAVRMAEAIGGLDAGLAEVERSASASGGPLERDVADLAGRLREFVRGVKGRAGLTDGGGSTPMSLDEFVTTYADRIPEEARKRPTALLDLYFDTVSRGGAKAAAGAALSEQDALAQVFTYVDTLHGLRAKAGDWDKQSGGAETVSLALDRLFEEFRGFLRAYSISIVAPEPGQVPDASVCRVSQSVPRPNAQSNTVVRVICCGFKHTMTGQVLRMAEVITAS